MKKHKLDVVAENKSLNSCLVVFGIIIVCILLGGLVLLTILKNEVEYNKALANIPSESYVEEVMEEKLITTRIIDVTDVTRQSKESYIYRIEVETEDGMYLTYKTYLAMFDLKRTQGVFYMNYTWECVAFREV